MEEARTCVVFVASPAPSPPPTRPPPPAVSCAPASSLAPVSPPYRCRLPPPSPHRVSEAAEATAAAEAAAAATAAAVAAAAVAGGATLAQKPACACVPKPVSGAVPGGSRSIGSAATSLAGGFPRSHLPQTSGGIDTITTSRNNQERRAARGSRREGGPSSLLSSCHSLPTTKRDARLRRRLRRRR